MLLSLSGHTKSLWNPVGLIVRLFSFSFSSFVLSDKWLVLILSCRWIKHKFLSKTQREWKEAEAPRPFGYRFGSYYFVFVCYLFGGEFVDLTRYAVSYTNHLMVFTILLLYSTLSPFIMIFGVLYFAMALVSNKYRILQNKLGQAIKSKKLLFDSNKTLCT